MPVIDGLAFGTDGGVIDLTVSANVDVLRHEFGDPTQHILVQDVEAVQKINITADCTYDALDGVPDTDTFTSGGFDPTEFLGTVSWFLNEREITWNREDDVQFRAAYTLYASGECGTANELTAFTSDACPAYGLLGPMTTATYTERLDVDEVERVSGTGVYNDPLIQVVGIRGVRLTKTMTATFEGEIPSGVSGETAYIEAVTPDTGIAIGGEVKLTATSMLPADTPVTQSLTGIITSLEKRESKTDWVTYDITIEKVEAPS